MFLSNFSIKRPIAMTAIIIVMILAGINSYRGIGLNVMPEIDIPYVTITTVYPGASPEEIEVDVAKKIEDAVSNVDGLKHVHSNCMENVCVTILEFQMSVDVDIAAIDVREKIDLILNDFPDDVESPKILKFDINAKPIATLLLTGDLPIDTLYDYADETLSDRLSTIEGVADVQVTGGEELEVHITINKEELASTGLNSVDVIRQLALNNIKVPSGNLHAGIEEISVTFDAEFKSLNEIKALEIGRSKIGRIYIGDIAEVTMMSKDKRTRAFYNSKPAVNLKITKKGEANAVVVVEKIKTLIKEIKDTNAMPGGINLVWFNDDAEFIQSSVSDAWYSVFLGIVLTAIILFMFLHEVRSTIIIIVSMPTSLIITFVVMRYFDYTFNNSTLLALGTSVGVLVTNSIVVIENIFKKLHSGLDPKEAAGIGTGEVVLPVFASAATNVVVFIPIAMMSSIIGRYFTPFAVTMTAVTLVSLFISFTLTPILSSQLLKNKMPTHKFLMRLYTKYWNLFYDKFENFYDKSLIKSSRQPWLILLSVFILFVLTFVFIVPNVGMGFMPENDRGEFIVKIEYPSYCNIDETIKRAMAIEKRIRKLPEVLSTSTLIGKVQGTLGQVSEGVYLAEIMVKTSGKNDREMNMDQMASMFRNELRNESDCIVTVNIPSIVGGSSSEIEMEIAGDDLKVLNGLGEKVAALAATSGLMVDVDNTVRAPKPEIKIIPKRPILQDMRVSAQLVGMLLRGNIEGIEVGTYKIADRSYDIRVELEEEKGLGQLKEYTLMTKAGRPLSIESVATLIPSSIPIQITRAEKRRIVKILANPAPGVALGDAVNQLRKLTMEVLPQGYSMRFAGKVEKMSEAQRDFLEAIIIASILTYLLIAAILESWTQPLMILVTLPLALVGLFLALFIAGIPLSMMGLLGAVMLIGIVVNNAILVIDNVILLRANGIPPKQAMLESAKEKFRPIVMTSIAAVLGILPMALGSGLGSELRSSCGIAVVGGLISSTILSLYVIPLIYIQFIKEKK